MVIFCSLCKRVPKGSFANLLAIGVVSGRSFVLFFPVYFTRFHTSDPYWDSVFNGFPMESPRLLGKSKQHPGNSLQQTKVATEIPDSEQIAALMVGFQYLKVYSNWFCDLFPDGRITIFHH